MLNVHLVQFRAHRGPRESHIGGHIVCFYNVIGSECGLANRNLLRKAMRGQHVFRIYLFGGKGLCDRPVLSLQVVNIRGVEPINFPFVGTPGTDQTITTVWAMRL